MSKLNKFYIIFNDQQFCREKMEAVEKKWKAIK